MDTNLSTRCHIHLDSLLIETQRVLEVVFGHPVAQRPSPANALPNPLLSPKDRRHAAGLMRINHVGEVCAQGLYFGQVAVARKEELRQHLLKAAQEETDHLAWCSDRLQELESRPSLFNPLWYAGSYVLGVFAGLVGDPWSLGFVVETERQVEAHLDKHLQTFPDVDTRSREILRVMKADEARHAEQAEQAGARLLPSPIPVAMAWAAHFMRIVAYRI
ncbi:2-polyprenyl-3-methyl-6-methoxy-1,4-benzoquinone monooxygenase [Xylella taiwanensis]|nr:2-polyprenyl-3-methyl-6-methoxy-1,4-benzoquinone monooxygenase [Xylella taiwanensis]AXI83837.1 2-octaprenyl-3-methyl-6-methoxy-1,4-benzoquinol hydroxylase [Xylella taiwanensis]MCD8456938.1 2-polyprenyl-3-methyl-6-methoxy-1,4-benzoquinone monooxygenase [Xylella taiwanensis]MCD8459349.1 2-polyprenyl-3-methyl-6-methoxy-1,4-benzoquinone monooxygenase [Xylella taiwanensis]MCD8461780.1 2-polyprenyl-3-methyl-6-methoxy-1,4-benzoquinone monooxygenase [Xylella taiwanensis]MCD8462187.1 2-polyprenyl-3-